eukprot:4160050-Amphidinium_carterae.2
MVVRELLGVAQGTAGVRYCRGQHHIVSVVYCCSANPFSLHSVIVPCRWSVLVLPPSIRYFV